MTPDPLASTSTYYFDAFRIYLVLVSTASALGIVAILYLKLRIWRDVRNSQRRQLEMEEKQDAALTLALDLLRAMRLYASGADKSVHVAEKQTEVVAQQTQVVASVLSQANSDSGHDLPAILTDEDGRPYGRRRSDIVPLPKPPTPPTPPPK